MPGSAFKVLIAVLVVGVLGALHLDLAPHLLLGLGTVFCVVLLGLLAVELTMKKRALERGEPPVLVSRKAIAKAQARAIQNQALLAERYLEASGDAHALARFRAARSTGVSESVLLKHARTSSTLGTALGIFAGLLAADTVNAALRSGALGALGAMVDARINAAGGLEALDIEGLTSRVSGFAGSSARTGEGDSQDAPERSLCSGADLGEWANSDDDDSDTPDDSGDGGDGGGGGDGGSWLDIDVDFGGFGIDF